MKPETAAFLADLVLCLHFSIATFVLLGFILIVVGMVRGWEWIKDRRFRLIHVAMVVLVALQALLGRACSLTSLESRLREMAGQEGYDRPFIATWISKILYWDFPLWVFTVVYIILALMTLGLFFYQKKLGSSHAEKNL